MTSKVTSSKVNRLTKSIFCFLFLVRPAGNKRMRLLLCLDGGGARSQFQYFLLLRLQQAMKRPLTEIFDLVAGVSAGAVLAALVAFQRVSVRDHIREMASLFSDPTPHGPIFQTKYHGQRKKAVFQQLFGDNTLADVSFPLVILAATMNGEPVVLSNAPAHPRRGVSLALALDASTAAHTYFPPVPAPRVDSSPPEYWVDGGVVTNNPALFAVKEAHARWGRDEPVAVLSLGTSAPRVIPVCPVTRPTDFGVLKWVQEADLLQLVTHTHNRLMVEFLPEIIGKGNLMRVVPTRVAASLDDVTVTAHELLKQEADRVWEECEDRIVTFLKARKSWRQ
jgi:predicted acylesterase/phospholipase RssA